VYTSLAPKSLTEQISDLETVRSLVRIELEKYGVAVPDLVKPLRKGSEEYKMFFQSSEELTEMAYYLVYNKIAELVHERFEQAEVILADSLSKARYPLGRGPHTDILGFGRDGIDEIVLSVWVKRNSTDWQNGSSEIIDKSRAYVSINSNADLPRAIVVRDSNGSGALDLLAECFSEMYVLGEGDREIPDEIIKEIAPDVVIYLVGETEILG
jgi:hypothetical protein